MFSKFVKFELISFVCFVKIGKKVFGLWEMIGSSTEFVGYKVSVNTKLVSGEVGGNIEVGGDIEVGKGLLKLILNKFPIVLVFILGTTVISLLIQDEFHTK